MPNTLTTQTPGQPPETRPVPPSWATVAPLLERWQMALIPQHDGTWHLIANYPLALSLEVHLGATSVPFDHLPQIIADVAARCAAAGEG